MRACLLENNDQVEGLLTQGAYVDEQNKDGWTGLMAAISRCHISTAKLLLDHRASTDIQSNDGSTALMIACAINDMDIINLLIQRGANINLQNKEFKTALMIAVTKQATEVVRLLINKRALVNLQNNDGWSALFIASKLKSCEIAKLLIASNASVDLQNKEGSTSLMRAAAAGLEDNVKLLLESRAAIDIQNKDGFTALLTAVAKGQLNTSLILITKKASINLQTKDGWTALMIACDHGYLDIARLLIHADADVNIQNKGGRTALMIAAVSTSPNAIDIIRLLLLHGAKMDVQNNDGWTALMLATRHPCGSIVSLLLEYGAAADVQNKDGLTALMSAAAKGFVSSCEAILNAGAHIDIQNKDGMTAAMGAISKGQVAAASLLLQRGASIEVQSSNGWTALSWATCCQQTEIIDLVQKRLLGGQTTQDDPAAIKKETSNTSAASIIDTPTASGSDVEDRISATTLKPLSSPRHVSMVSQYLSSPAILVPSALTFGVPKSDVPLSNPMKAPSSLSFPPSLEAESTVKLLPQEPIVETAVVASTTTQTTTSVSDSFPQSRQPQLLERSIECESSSVICELTFDETAYATSSLPSNSFALTGSKNNMVMSGSESNNTSKSNMCPSTTGSLLENIRIDMSMLNSDMTTVGEQVQEHYTAATAIPVAAITANAAATMTTTGASQPSISTVTTTCNTDTLHIEISRLTNDNQELIFTNKLLQRQIEEIEYTNIGLRDSLNTTDTEVEQLRISLSTYSNEISHLQALLEQASDGASIVRLTTEYKNLAQEKLRLDEEVAKWKQIDNNKSAIFIEHDRKMSIMMKKLADMKAENRIISEQLELVQSELCFRNDQIERSSTVENELIACKNDMQQLQRRLDISQVEEQRAQRLVQTLSSDLMISRTQCSFLQAEIQRTADAKQELRQSNNELLLKISEVTAIVDEAGLPAAYAAMLQCERKKVLEANQEVNKHKLDIARCQHELLQFHSLEKELNDYKSRIQTLEEEKETLSHELTTVRNSQENMSSLEREVAVLKTELSITKGLTTLTPMNDQVSTASLVDSIPTATTTASITANILSSASEVISTAVCSKNKTAQQMIQDYREEIRILQLRIDQCDSNGCELAVCKLDKVELQHQNRMLSENIQILERDIQESDVRMTTLKSELLHCKDELIELGAIKVENARLQGDLKKAKIEVSAARSDMKKSSVETIELRSQIELLSAELRKVADDMDEERRHLQLKLKDTEKTLLEVTECCTSLGKELMQKEEQNQISKELEAEVGNYKTKVARLQADIKRYKQELTDTAVDQDRLREVEASLCTTRDDNLQLQLEVERLQSLTLTQRIEIEKFIELEKSWTESKAELLRNQAQERDSGFTKAKFVRLSLDNKKMSDELDLLKLQRSDLKNRVQQLEEELSGLQNEKLTLESKLALHLKEGGGGGGGMRGIHDVEQELGTYKMKVLRLQSDVKKLQIEKSDLQAASNDSTILVKSLKEALHSCQFEVEKSSSAIAVSKAQIVNMQAELERLVKALESTTAEKQRWRTEAIKNKQQREKGILSARETSGSKAELQALQQNLERLKMDSDTFIALQGEVEELREQKVKWVKTEKLYLAAKGRIAQLEEEAAATATPTRSNQQQGTAIAKGSTTANSSQNQSHIYPPVPATSTNGPSPVAQTTVANTELLVMKTSVTRLEAELKRSKAEITKLQSGNVTETGNGSGNEQSTSILLKKSQDEAAMLRLQLSKYEEEISAQSTELATLQTEINNLKNSRQTKLLSTGGTSSGGSSTTVCLSVQSGNASATAAVSALHVLSSLTGEPLAVEAGRESTGLSEVGSWSLSTQSLLQHVDSRLYEVLSQSLGLPTVATEVTLLPRPVILSCADLARLEEYVALSSSTGDDRDTNSGSIGESSIQLIHLKRLDPSPDNRHNFTQPFATVSSVRSQAFLCLSKAVSSSNYHANLLPILGVCLESEMSQQQLCTTLSGTTTTAGTSYTTIVIPNISNHKKTLYESLLDSEIRLKMDWKSRLRIAVGIASALHHLHSTVYRTVPGTSELSDTKGLSSTTCSSYGQLHPHSVYLTCTGTTSTSNDHPLLSYYPLINRYPNHSFDNPHSSCRNNTSISDTSTTISSCMSSLQQYQPSTSFGFPGYIDPYYLQTGHMSIYNDIYVFGVILLQLLSGEANVIDPSKSPKTLMARFSVPGRVIAEKATWPGLATAAITRLVRECTSLDVEDRPVTFEIIIEKLSNLI